MPRNATPRLNVRLSLSSGHHYYTCYIRKQNIHTYNGTYLGGTSHYMTYNEQLFPGGRIADKFDNEHKGDLKDITVCVI
ncbi:hypothetical protein M8J77_023346 [Diaphorina citri]|nr:hypothetical protein M8J77_023346 [Diaphorina citri]